MVKLIITDDERLFRKGLIQLLKGFNIEVIADCDSGCETLDLLKILTPDILILDLEMPGLNGSETLDAVKKKYPSQKIIILSSYHNEEIILDHLNRGAGAFVSKNENLNNLVAAIYKVKEEGSFKDNISSLINTRVEKNSHYYKLLFTDKERAIIFYLCKAAPLKIISQELNISAKTVETHITEIYKKLRVKNRMEFLNYANKEGLGFLGKT